MDLELLRTFAAIHRTGTLTGAAKLLGVSQPTVTARLRSLEGHTATRLFEGDARGCRATPAADELAARLHLPLAELESVAESLGGQSGLAGATLRLGAPAEFTEYVLPSALAGLAAGGLTTHVTLGLAADLQQGLTAGTLDLVVSTAKPPKRTVWQPLLDEEFVLVAAPRLAAGLAPRALRDRPAATLGALPLVSYDGQQSIIRLWGRHVLGAPPPAASRVTVPDLRTVRRLVIEGAGISALPRYLCASELAAGELVVLVEPEDSPINTFYLVTLRQLRTRPAVAAAWTAIQGAVRNGA